MTYGIIILYKQPVIFNLYVHCCPWHKFFQRADVPENHSVIGVGLYKDGSIHCIDCQPVNFGAKLPSEYFIKGNDGIVTTYNTLPFEKYEVDWKEIIQNTLLKLYARNEYGNSFDSIRAFSKDFKTLNLIEETKGYDVDEIWNTHLLHNILSVCIGREQFSKLLKYFSEKFGIGELLKASQKLKYAAAKWSTIRGLLIKAKMLSSENNIAERVSQIINEIADIEENVAENLLQAISGGVCTNNLIKDNDIMHKYSDDNADIEVFMLDISEYFNNNAFGSFASKNSQADLTGTGHYFLKNGLPDDGIIKVDNNMIFKIKVSGDGINDNISCEGQIFELQNLLCKKGIMLLGCAEWGDFFEKLIINYTDGESEEIYIEFLDWWRGPAQGQTIAWEGQAAEKNMHGAELLGNKGRYLCARTYCTKLNKKIKNIILPNCPNIHLFAVSLA